VPKSQEQERQERQERLIDAATKQFEPSRLSSKFLIGQWAAAFAVRKNNRPGGFFAHWHVMFGVASGRRPRRRYFGLSRRKGRLVIRARCRGRMTGFWQISELLDQPETVKVSYGRVVYTLTDAEEIRDLLSQILSCVLDPNGSWLGKTAPRPSGLGVKPFRQQQPGRVK
jgi:hypothetical protein